MGAIERKTSIFENVARLRRVERELPPNRDLVAVRTALEQDLGETVSRRFAARLLGVSHTALERWVASGDLPTVVDATGREGVPVEAVLDLRDAIEAERDGGPRRGHVIEAALRQGRDRADRLDVEALVPSTIEEGGHDRASRRSLAYHRALARGLNREMADDALRQLWKWRLQGAIDPRYADRWERILLRPLAEIRQAISEDSEAARDLRQSSPFAGMLSEAERRKILRHVR
jgi:hypothetical protein